MNLGTLTLQVVEFNKLKVAAAPNKYSGPFLVECTILVFTPIGSTLLLEAIQDMANVFFWNGFEGRGFQLHYNSGFFSLF